MSSQLNYTTTEGMLTTGMPSVVDMIFHLFLCYFSKYVYFCIRKNNKQQWVLRM